MHAALLWCCMSPSISALRCWLRGTCISHFESKLQQKFKPVFKFIGKMLTTWNAFGILSSISYRFKGGRSSRKIATFKLTVCMNALAKVFSGLGKRWDRTLLFERMSSRDKWWNRPKKRVETRLSDNFWLWIQVIARLDELAQNRFKTPIFSGCFSLKEFVHEMTWSFCSSPMSASEFESSRVADIISSEVE